MRFMSGKQPSSSHPWKVHFNGQQTATSLCEDSSQFYETTNSDGVFTEFQNEKMSEHNRIRLKNGFRQNNFNSMVTSTDDCYVFGGGRPRDSGEVSNQQTSSIFNILNRTSHTNAHGNKMQAHRIYEISPQSTSKNRLYDFEHSIYISDYTSTSYGSIFSQLREVNKESKGELEFLIKSFRIIWCTMIMSVFLVTIVCLPFVMVILGVKYLNSCPQEPYIPIYLLVGGCFWLLKMFTVIWRQMRSRKNAQSADCIGITSKQTVL